MITFEPFYQTLKRRKLSTYVLINKYNVSRSLLDRLKHNKPVTTMTINDLCAILNCDVNDIMRYIPDRRKKDDAE